MAKAYTRGSMETIPHYYDIAEYFIVNELAWHHKNFQKKQQIPFISYEKEVEKQYRKDMINALALVLDYYGVTVETKQCKAKGSNPTAVGGKADSATLP